MNKKSFILYQDQGQIFDKLTDYQAGKLIKAIFKYNTGEAPELNEILSIIFLPIKQAMDRDLKKFENICERNKGNIKKRWLKDTKSTSGISGIPNPLDNDNDNDIKKTSSNKKHINYLRDLDNHALEEIGKELNITPAQVKDKSLDLVLYCESHGKTYANYNATLKAWLRKDIKEANLKQKEEGGYISGKTFSYPK
jgi:hypothetical protein